MKGNTGLDKETKAFIKKQIKKELEKKPEGSALELIGAIAVIIVLGFGVCYIVSKFLGDFLIYKG